MGSKVTVTELGNPLGSSFLSQLNGNLDAVADEFDSVLYRDGSQSMTGSLNMNSKRLFNLPEPILENEPIRLRDVGYLAKGDPGSAGEGYVNRVMMAGATVSHYDDGYLLEAGREGKFV